MDPQYTLLQNDPPAYSEPGTAPDHALLSSATEQNSSGLVPGEMARHVHVDPIVTVTPLSYGFSNSYIKLRASVLPRRPLLLANISACSWILTGISLIFFDISVDACEPDTWPIILTMAQVYTMFFTIPMFAKLGPGLVTFTLYVVQVLAQSSLQLFFARSVSEEYYSKCLVAFVITALLGLFNLCANYWYFHCAGQAALAAVAASQYAAAEEGESHAHASLGPNTTTDLPPKHKP